MTENNITTGDNGKKNGISRRSLLQASTSILTGTVITNALGSLGGRSFGSEPSKSQPKPVTAVEAVDVEQREVYRSARKPAYTSWVSLFPGHDGEWYLSCEEVYASTPPQKKAPLDDWYRMGLPDGYDKSYLKMDVVLLESKDQCASWKVISSSPVRFQHSAGSFAGAKTRDGRFLRGVWSCYGLDKSAHPGELLYESRDDGKTWHKQPALLPARFAAYPHRMKQLRDGTLVLAVPYAEMWGRDAALPLRTSMRVNAEVEMQMSLFFSRDEGKSWTGPTALFPGHVVSETDFVELKSGDLLAFNNSIFAQPGCQKLFRSKQGFIPGPFLKSFGQTVPETVTATREGILVGSMRNGDYYWPNDEGQNWFRLPGAPNCGYQPMIRQLSDGRILCAWHRGADDAFEKANQYIGIHLFRLKVNRPTLATRLNIEREFDPQENRFSNVYTLTLTAGGKPIASKTVELWYVSRYQPGYDSWCHTPIETRMKQGGKLIRAKTDQTGKARFKLPEYDKVTNIHLSYQLFARFNADRSDPDYKPAATPQNEFYAFHHGNGSKQ